MALVLVPSTRNFILKFYDIEVYINYPKNVHTNDYHIVLFSNVEIYCGMCVCIYIYMIWLHYIGTNYKKAIR